MRRPGANGSSSAASTHADGSSTPPGRRAHASGNLSDVSRVVMLTVDAPGAQPLFVDFVNTLHWYEGAPIELIGTPADLALWLAEHALPAVAGEASLQTLLALREHARAATEALSTGQIPAAADLAALSAALGAPTGR